MFIRKMRIFKLYRNLLKGRPLIQPYVVNVVNGTRDQIMQMVASTSLVDAPFKEK